MLRYAWYFKDDHYLAKVADVQKQAGAELGQAQLQLGLRNRQARIFVVSK